MPTRKSTQNEIPKNRSLLPSKLPALGDDTGASAVTDKKKRWAYYSLCKKELAAYSSAHLSRDKFIGDARKSQRRISGSALQEVILGETDFRQELQELASSRGRKPLLVGG